MSGALAIRGLMGSGRDFGLLVDYWDTGDIAGINKILVGVRGPSEIVEDCGVMEIHRRLVGNVEMFGISINQ